MSGLGNASALVFDKVRETSAASTKYFDIQHEISQTKRKKWKKSINDLDTPQFNTSVPHKRATPFHYTPKTPQFNTPLSSTPKPLGSTPKTLSSTHPSVLRGCWCWTEGCVELRVFGVEPRGFWVGTERVLGAEKEWSLCGTDVLNWGSLCETAGYSYNDIQF